MQSSRHVFDPPCMYWAPRRIQSLWGTKSIFITENGCSASAMVADDGRCNSARRCVCRECLAQSSGPRPTACRWTVSGYLDARPTKTRVAHEHDSLGRETVLLLNSGVARKDESGPRYSADGGGDSTIADGRKASERRPFSYGHVSRVTSVGGRRTHRIPRRTADGRRRRRTLHRRRTKDPTH